MKQTTDSLPKKIYLDYIDGLKGIAILMVLIFHVSLEFQDNFYFLNFQEKVEHFSRGVHLFFIVSGFSLFHSSSYWPYLKHPNIAFYLKRFFRIFPLWCLITTLYHFFWAPPHSINDYLATMFLYFGFSQYAWNIMIVPVAWSLFVEESFYVLFPVWKKYITTWKVAIALLVLSYIVAIKWYSISYRVFEGPHFSAIHPLGNYYAFFLGILLFHLNKRFHLENTRSLFVSQLINFLCVISIILIFSYDRLVGTLALTSFFLAALIPYTYFGKIVRLKIVKQFGICSYSIYVFHLPIIIVMKPFRFPTLEALGVINSYGEIQIFIWFILISCICLCVGKISWFLFEETSIRLGKIFIKKINS